MADHEPGVRPGGCGVSAILAPFTRDDFVHEGPHFYKAYRGDVCATICGGYCVRNGIIFAWAISYEDRMLYSGTDLDFDDAIDAINSAMAETEETV